MNHGPRDDHGCKLVKISPNNHPVLCRNSVQRHKCINKDCKFTHIRGTKRKQAMTGTSVKTDQDDTMTQAAPAAPQQQKQPNVVPTNNLLEIFLELKTYMLNLPKVVEAQGHAL